MKARITLIQDGKVWAKTVNPMGEIESDDDYENVDWICFEPKELELHFDSIKKTGNFPLQYVYIGIPVIIEIGDEINIIEIENKFKIV